ncbi:transcriptional regulator, RpiR family [Pelagirhabdus alkalitolerans]|uniref:Transcriptional regulator, RpiR family n=1 Tax=Pelagirhabdus alkalitolerans TaxID=1612202 RepID=A0A1G6GKE9_9BACI|nr:MurR/RpiR family transcriptional regulator [Pelagirhabdus alkalitolerans]SDB82215.1 transcriptional regulator, RpiR family [Pelagirhabdus alkalitolerans]
MQNGQDLTLKPSLQLEQFKHQLTKSEQKIFQYIQSHPQSIIYDSLTEFAEKSRVAEATALRFFRKLGYSGFQAFKLAYAHEQSADRDEKSEHERFSAQIKHSMATTIEESFELLDESTLSKVIDRIDDSDDVVVFGIGASGIAGLDMQNRLMRIGKNITVVTDTHTQIMRATSATKKTVLIAISLSGSTKEIIDHVQIAKDKGATIIALTNYAKSPLSSLADHVLLSSYKENPLDRGSLIAKVSQLYLIDCICTGLSIKNSEHAQRIKHEITQHTTPKIY